MQASRVDIYVIACGGDGTVIWVIEELVAASPNFERITISLLPLGTGNDFSIATGFGGKQL